MLTACEGGGPLTVSVKAFGVTVRPAATVVTLIAPVKPLSGVAETVVVPAGPPGATLTAVGEAERVKSVGAVTTRLAETVLTGPGGPAPATGVKVKVIG